MWIYYSVRYAVTGAALPEGVLVQPASVLRLGFPGATAYDPQEPFIVAAIVAAAGVLLANLRRACQDDAATPLPVPS
jgi:predicted LPLAT superfamily acyltransferase